MDIGKMLYKHQLDRLGEAIEAASRKDVVGVIQDFRIDQCEGGIAEYSKAAISSGRYALRVLEEIMLDPDTRSDTKIRAAKVMTDVASQVLQANVVAKKPDFKVQINNFEEKEGRVSEIIDAEVRLEATK